ncbi:hypothetical protein CVT24_010440, partial [Panaeolus cyanescens]
RLAPPAESVPASPSLPATPDLSSLLATPRTSLKPNLPPTYLGDRSTGRAFLHSCNAYYRLRTCDFRDDQTRIRWVLTFLTGDRAGRWANRIYNWETDHPNSTYFRDWEAFVTAFKTEFFPLFPEQEAMNKLESDEYWQQSRFLDLYIDEFQDLAREAHLTDQRQLVLKFRRGLKPSLQDSIATMASGRPADDNLDAWIRQARLVEQNAKSNAAFRANLPSSRSGHFPKRHVSMPLVTVTPPAASASSFPPASERHALAALL